MKYMSIRNSGRDRETDKQTITTTTKLEGVLI